MICDLDTKMWSDPWFEGLNPKAKLLFIYLWTNNHKNLPCLYEITKSTISNEIKFSQADVGKLLKQLHPKVIYIEADNLIWVVNSVRRQFLKNVKVSDTIITGIKKALMQLPEGHPLIEEFLNKYSILGIGYPYPIKGVSGDPLGVGEGVGVGEGDLKSFKEVFLYKEIIEDLNEVLETEYEHTTEDIQKLIRARWSEGYRLDDFKTITSPLLHKLINLPCLIRALVHISQT